MNRCFHNGRCTYAQCGRRRHLVLFKGDDTSAAGGTGFEFFFVPVVDDMSEYAIELKFLGVTKTAEEFTTHDDGRLSFTVQFTHAETGSFPLCWQNAAMYIVEKATGLRKTLSNTILVHVTDDVKEAYDSTGNEADISIQSGSIMGAFSGITLDLNASLADRMQTLAEVVKRGGGTVIEEEIPEGDDDGQ